MAADIGHINTKSVVTGYHPGEEAGLESALKGAEIVLIPAGVPRKPGMTRDGIFHSMCTYGRILIAWQIFSIPMRLLYEILPRQLQTQLPKPISSSFLILY